MRRPGFVGRAVLCTIVMLEFARLNRKKIAQCEREGITEDMVDEFVEMGDASPLYRLVVSSLRVPILPLPELLNICRRYTI